MSRYQSDSVVGDIPRSLRDWGDTTRDQDHIMSGLAIITEACIDVKDVFAD